MTRLSRFSAEKTPGPYLYPEVGSGAPEEVQQAIEEYNSLSAEERAETPLLYWLLGDGTPPYKRTKTEVGYVGVSPYQQKCGNCLHAYQHVTSGTSICDQMRGVIQPEGWCLIWKPKMDPQKYRAYQERIASRVASRYLTAKYEWQTGDGTEVWTGFRLPSPLKEGFPHLGERDQSPPHVTYLYLGKVDLDRVPELILCLKDIFRHAKPTRATFTGLDYFVNPAEESRIAINRVRFDRDLTSLRWVMRERLLEEGFDVEDQYPLVYQPHTTLKYMEDLRSAFEGEVPLGSWVVDELEIWGLPKIYKIPFGGLTANRVGGYVSPSRVASRWSEGEGLGYLFEPSYNLREALKQLILLEDHLAHERKRCPDCIDKHCLTIEALCDEGVQLEPDGPLVGALNLLSKFIQEAQQQLGSNPEGVCRHLRQVRKQVMPLVSERMKTAERRVTVYHISPDANIQRFRGRHSPKHKGKGLFVSKSKRAILDSWARYVRSKKHEKHHMHQPGGYQNLTLYTLSLPADAFGEAARRHSKRKEDAWKRILDRTKDELTAALVMYSAWDWDEEVFIPQKLLPEIKIEGRDTRSTKEFTKTRKRPENVRKDLPGAAKVVKDTNKAAEEYLRLNRLVSDRVLRGTLTEAQKSRIQHLLQRFFPLLVDMDWSPWKTLPKGKESTLSSLVGEIEYILEQDA